TWATLTTLGGSLAAMLFAAGLVQRFSGKGLVTEAVSADPAFLLAVAVAAALTVLLATRLGFPVSTTHALLGALVGAGLVIAGPRQLSCATLGQSFVAPLLFSPVASILLAATMYVGFRSARRALGVSEETCVCIGGTEELATYVPGTGAVRLSRGITIAVDQPERCARRYAG